MPKSKAAKKKQIEKKEMPEMLKIRYAIEHQTPKQKAIGEVIEDMRTDGVSVPTPNKKNKIVKVRADRWLDIRTKQLRGKELEYEEKVIAQYYEKRLKELMKK